MLITKERAKKLADDGHWNLSCEPADPLSTCNTECLSTSVDDLKLIMIVAGAVPVVLLIIILIVTCIFFWSLSIRYKDVKSELTALIKAQIQEVMKILSHYTIYFYIFYFCPVY